MRLQNLLIAIGFIFMMKISTVHADECMDYPQFGRPSACFLIKGSTTCNHTAGCYYEGGGVSSPGCWGNIKPCSIYNNSTSCATDSFCHWVTLINTTCRSHNDCAGGCCRYTGQLASECYRPQCTNDSDCGNGFRCAPADCTSSSIEKMRAHCEAKPSQPSAYKPPTCPQGKNIAQVTLNERVRISYFYNFSMKTEQTRELAPDTDGACHEIYNAPGGGKTSNDIARCYLDQNGELKAFNKDSAWSAEHWAKTNRNGCSEAWHDQYVVRCCFEPSTEISIRYYFSFSMPKEERVKVRPGASYVIHNSPGGGNNGNDIARCILGTDGSLMAYNKDSAAPKAVYSQSIHSGCSEARWGGYVVRCCFE